jgi:ion channel-forming bestrophin family protein
MIIYETNKHFLGDIKHLTRSWTMRKMLRSTLAVALITTAFSIIVEETALDIHAPSTIFSLLGIVLSVLLVFRTNTAYDRWWEGRKQWGALVNNCRNMAIMTQAIFPEDDYKSRHEMATLISNFCIALKEHLRQGTRTDELIHLSAQQLEAYGKRAHIPNYISTLIHQKVQLMYRSGAISGADVRNMKPHLQALLDIAGACERIKKTPIPFSYSVYIKLLILAYSLMLPFGLIRDFSYFTIPLVTFIFFTFIGIEMMASEIEDPFGLDCNDLPTGDIAQTITKNVFEILEVNLEAQPAQKKELYEKVF